MHVTPHLPIHVHVPVLPRPQAQMTATPTLDLPGSTMASPRSTQMMTLGSGTYDMYGTTPRSLVCSRSQMAHEIVRGEKMKEGQLSRWQNDGRGIVWGGEKMKGELSGVAK